MVNTGLLRAWGQLLTSSILRPREREASSTATGTRMRPFPPLTCSSIERRGLGKQPSTCAHRSPILSSQCWLTPSHTPSHPHRSPFSPIPTLGLPIFFSYPLSLFLVPFLFVCVLLSLCICYLYFSSAGKEFTCNAGDPGSIPGLGRSPGEGIGYPLQCSWASLVAQMVKNPAAMWETWVWSLGWEDLLEEVMATHSSILAWRIPWTEEPGRLQSTALQRVRLN